MEKKSLARKTVLKSTLESVICLHVLSQFTGPNGKLTEEVGDAVQGDRTGQVAVGTKTAKAVF